MYDNNFYEPLAIIGGQFILIHFNKHLPSSHSDKDTEGYWRKRQKKISYH